MMIRCLAIDDEVLALELLEDNIRKVPFLDLVQACKSGYEAMEIIQREKIDLVFLDIQMPDISGIQFLKSLKNKPLVIFTTAYEKYALQGFELDVIDYLLKPFSFERFLKSVNKAQEYINLLEKPVIQPSKEELPFSENYLFVKSDYKLVKIDIKDILYVEGLKDYIKIYIQDLDRPVITLSSMKAVEEKLPAAGFIRVHRSFIVAINKVSFIQRNTVHIGNKEIPVSEHHKENLFNIIHKNKIID
ncbi:MAG: LytTR family DNA-binding domain-containing protein [Bacteroidetes bacterium]|nr:LytTR family DNA-binding domain-containing protein [Bacteroidota bacterium]